jgi:hypothetical protein
MEKMAEVIFEVILGLIEATCDAIGALIFDRKKND